MAFENNLKNISIIGMGHVGTCLAALAASRGVQVVGMETDPEKVSMLKNGLAPVYESGLDELLKLHQQSIRITWSYRQLVKSSKLTIITVPAWDEDNEQPSLIPLIRIIENLAEELRNLDGFHSIVLTGTMVPGSISNVLVSILQNMSWKVNGDAVGLCYLPMFTERGRTLLQLEKTTHYIVGSPGGYINRQMELFLTSICGTSPEIQWMDPTDAEIAKLSIDSWHTIQSGFSNMLGELCERLPGADVHRIFKQLDGRGLMKNSPQTVSRLEGPYHMQSHTMMLAWAEQQRNPVPMLEAVEKMKLRQPLRLLDHLINVLPNRGHVAVLGFAYQPNTDCVDHTVGLAFIHWLLKQNFTVSVYDPAAMAQARQYFGAKINYATSLSACIDQADAIVILTPWDEFRILPVDVLQKKSKPPVIIDCWRICNTSEIDQYVRIIHPGVGYFHNFDRPLNHFDYNLVDLLEISQLSNN
ncbi:UDP-glucose/GDP-mannose dehydrogenase family protein [candidate division KSB1 bacterium]|nr:UDP-glucose/GDP-mannose dehydrogenase family protein [candidate division KSB1 bacterium]